MSNNFDGPVILDQATSYIGFGRLPGTAQSERSRIYHVSADPNLIVFVPAPTQGSIAIQSDPSPQLWQYDELSLTWNPVGSGGGGSTFYPVAAILRPSGPVDADNVVTTPAEARALLASTSGPRVFRLDAVTPDETITLDAGTYGDDDVIMVGHSPDGSAVTVVVDGAVVFPIREFREVTMNVLTVPAPMLDLQNGQEIVLRNSVITGAFTPGSAAPILVNGDVEMTLDNSQLSSFGPLVQVAAAGTLRITVSGVSRIEQGLIPVIAGLADSSSLRVGIDQPSYETSLAVHGSQAFSGAARSNFRPTATTVRFFIEGASRFGSDTTRILGPGDTDTLPPLDTVPTGYILWYARNDQAGADGQVVPDGSEVLLPADPALLPQGTTKGFVKIRPPGGAFWSTVG